MKKLITLLVLIPVVASGAEYYKLNNVKKIDRDLYRSDNLIIETKHCYHYTTYGEEAILKWEGDSYRYGNKIIWADDSNCDVAKVFR
jgi:hypothetical protein